MYTQNLINTTIHKLFMIKLQKPLLIPSIEFNKLEQLKELRKYFTECELNLFSINPKHGHKKLCIARSILKDYRMSVYSVHAPPFDISKSDVEEKKAALAFSRTVLDFFQPKVLVFHPGRGDEETLLANMYYIIENLEKDVTITLENMTSNKAIVHSPETIARIVEKTAAFPQNFGICIDTSHPWFEHETTDSLSYTKLLLSYLSAAKDRLKHLHLSDRQKGENRHSIKHLPIGSGIINWEMFKNHISTINYSGMAVMEVDGVEAIISSACNYYGVGQNDLKIKMEDIYMPERKIFRPKEMFDYLSEILRQEFPFSLRTLLKPPEELILKKSKDYDYFFVPSEYYETTGIDPHYAITGDEEGIHWASYLFGLRKEGGRLYAILIDRERRIAVEEIIFDVYNIDPSKGGKVDWEIFENAIKTALMKANQYKDADHVELVWGGLTIIPRLDKRAWSEKPDD